MKLQIRTLNGQWTSKGNVLQMGRQVFKIFKSDRYRDTEDVKSVKQDVQKK